MPAPLRQAILEVANRTESSGATMGDIVDQLAGAGYTDTSIEAEVWTLLAERRLTPCGFVCRKVRRRDATGEMELRRSYEFLLIPWSADADKQLELQLAVDEAQEG